MSLRKPINAKCRQCIHDPLDKGSAAQQIACCTIKTCPLHSIRPITCKSISRELLDHWHLTEADLCDRARLLVETATPCSAEGQNDELQDITGDTNAEVLVKEVKS